jgi:uncharacterized membrane protein YphA (DoxX/SURF4 family)
MDRLSIPDQVVYAGLAGTLLALVVAAATNGWSLRVFCLLALRLAIGWHFLFEGLHKIHSSHLGPTETSRPFSSEPYFKVAPTWFGKMMRAKFDDPLAVIAEKTTKPKEMTAAEFAKLSGEEQAKLCPPAVAKTLDEMEDETEASIKADAEREKQAAKTDADRQAAQRKADSFKETGLAFRTAAKAKYARWVYGVDDRDAKVKFLTGDAPLSAPERLEHLDWIRQQLEQVEHRRTARLGNGSYEVKRASELRTDLQTEEAALATDANAFVAELLTELNGGTPVKEDPATKPVPLGKRMDQVTMWFIAAVGAGLLAGLFTRLNCVLGAGFLVMTYLTHPAVPWYPQPPMTEGNPLFINKNVIEAVALLTLATFPTGRWLGLDALIALPFTRKKPAAA